MPSGPVKVEDYKISVPPRAAMKENMEYATFKVRSTDLGAGL
jgi:hypothetical protein